MLWYPIAFPNLSSFWILKHSLFNLGVTIANQAKYYKSTIANYWIRPVILSFPLDIILSEVLQNCPRSMFLVHKSWQPWIHLPEYIYFQSKIWNFSGKIPISQCNRLDYAMNCLWDPAKCLCSLRKLCSHKWTVYIKLLVFQVLWPVSDLLETELT